MGYWGSSVLEKSTQSLKLAQEKSSRLEVISFFCRRKKLQFSSAKKPTNSISLGTNITTVRSLRVENNQRVSSLHGKSPAA